MNSTLTDTKTHQTTWQSMVAIVFLFVILSLAGIDVQAQQSVDAPSIVSVQPARGSEADGKIIGVVVLDAPVATPVDVYLVRRTNQYCETQAFCNARQGPQGDFYGSLDILTFQPGETSKTFETTLIDDPFCEPESEVFDAKILLVEGGGVLIGKQYAAQTIDNDNDCIVGGKPIFSVFHNNNGSVTEGEGTIFVTVRLTSGGSTTRTVDVATGVDRSGWTNFAAPGQDFYGFYRQLEFKPGETQKTLPIKIINDNCKEDREKFFVRLFNPGEGSFISPLDDIEELTIIDDDRSCA